MPTPVQADRPADTPDIPPETRGDIFMAKKQYREAIDAFRQGSHKDPVIWNKIGIAYHQMLQFDQALKSYQEAVKLKKDYQEAINNIGTIYYARRSFRRSITYYERALKAGPESGRSAAIYNNLGTAYFARKEYKRAADSFQTALTLDPDVFEHTSTYGVMLEERSVQERAKYHYYLAKLYAKNGRDELALQYLRKSLEEGFKERKQLQTDPEFATLRNTKEFKDLLALEPRVL
ncbi:MAG TPA: tetratricopeptide repeat protein [Bryobacteraceae bacterium]|nr:tetratricopeptide repeat protein [Bryobacteraceae bacterium]